MARSAVASPPNGPGSISWAIPAATTSASAHGRKDDWTFWRAKGADTFAPVGPWIETELDPQQLDLLVRINGEEVQRCNTSDMLFSFAEIVSYISQHVTLRPGDLVFSGATGVTRAIVPGDVVEVDIPGIGVLSNPVIAEFEAGEG